MITKKNVPNIILSMKSAKEIIKNRVIVSNPCPASDRGHHWVLQAAEAYHLDNWEKKGLMDWEGIYRFSAWGICTACHVKKYFSGGLEVME